MSVVGGRETVWTVEAGDEDCCGFVHPAAQISVIMNCQREQGRPGLHNRERIFRIISLAIPGHTGRLPVYVPGFNSSYCPSGFNNLRSPMKMQSSQQTSARTLPVPPSFCMERPAMDRVPELVDRESRDAGRYGGVHPIVRLIGVPIHTTSFFPDFRIFQPNPYGIRLFCGAGGRPSSCSSVCRWGRGRH